MKISQKVYNEKDLINLINNLFKKIRQLKCKKINDYWQKNSE